MDKQQTILVALTALVAVIVVCSAYTAFQQPQDNTTHVDYTSLKEKISEVNQYGGKIYCEGNTFQKSSSTSPVSISVSGDFVVIKDTSSTGTSTTYMLLSSVTGCSVNNH